MTTNGTGHGNGNGWPRIIPLITSLLAALVGLGRWLWPCLSRKLPQEPETPSLEERLTCLERTVNQILSQLREKQS